MKKNNILPMTHSHPKWNEFIYRLSSLEGCNFREKSKDEPEKIIWDCSGSMERPFAVAILQKIGNIDIPKSLEYFDEHSGFCDCEILINMDK